jgi:predicted MPP superfamily phosphohydrolase
LSIRSKIKPVLLRKEIATLKKSEFIKETTIKEETKKGTVKIQKAFVLNTASVYKSNLEALLLDPKTIDKKDILKKIKANCKIDLLILSGFFIGSKNSRVDMLVVGKKIDTKKIEKSVREIESLLGTEIVYAIFETKDFLYRMSMYDKLIADVLDFPHERLFDTIKLSTRHTFRS